MVALTASVRGRGLATEGAIALCDDGLGRIGLDRLVSRCQPGNFASLRVMKRIGMRFERDGWGRHGEVVRIYALARAGWLSPTSAHGVRA